MKYTAAAKIKSKITAAISLNNKIAATAKFNTLSPISQPCPQYNLIDGGQPNTIYQDINGFNLINGGQP